MLVRIIIFLGIALLIFGPLNLLVYRQLVRIHPRRKRWTLTAVILGNLLWPLLPFLQASNPFIRFTRALLGPMWFGWAVFTLLYTLFLFLVLLAWSPFRKRASFTAFAHMPSRVFLSLLIVGFFVGYYQALVPLRVERVTIRVANLPLEASNMRIALLGDLHVGLFSRPGRLEKIFRTTTELRPDVVLLAGDLIDDDPFFVPKLLAGAAHVPNEIPLLAVLGNHEIYGDPDEVIERLRGSRIRLLVNEGYALRSLWIAGISDDAARQMGGRKHLAPDVDKALAAKPAGAMPIMLVHQPKAIREATKHGIPVMLCAHAHGGQFGIRPLGWSLAGVFLPHHMGLYQVGETHLYVNTGTGYWLLPFRLGMTPEITLIELVK